MQQFSGERKQQEQMQSKIEQASSKVPTKGERFREILQYLHGLPPSKNQIEAYHALEKAFEDIEGKYYPEFESRFQESGVSNDIFKMRINGVDRHIKYNGRHIAVIKSERDYTFLGANGAIEMQVKKGNLEKENPGGEIFFEKKGADGKGVWE